MTNFLANEASPYLQQHINNPVAWYPWGTAALEKAKQENKPILLSIGYSACHWCHVMAHESFEDDATAAIMNEHFINIKVDREERPDLDKIYQTTHHLLTQRSGGWPLTAILHPHTLAPFFSGTYFPPVAHYGLPAFKDLLLKISLYYHSHPKGILQQNEQLLNVLSELAKTEFDAQTLLNASPIQQARQQLAAAFDQQYGGFEKAPKFPHPNNYELLLRHWTSSKQTDQDALAMTTLSLDKMAEGGIYDQIGGGFFRYSVDQQWVIPHFEKMLYDNASLLEIYAQAYAMTGKALYKTIAEETAAWAIRDMRDTHGGYYATLNADSEQQEGKFYIWDRQHVKSLLTEAEYKVVSAYYGLNLPPNFEQQWHLLIQRSISDIAALNALSEQQIKDLIHSSRQKLFNARLLKIPPSRDEKILTAWNSLMIKSLAATGLLLNRPDFVQAAQTVVDFIRNTMWQDKKLLAVCKDDQAYLPAYLDDYAFLIDGIFMLLQAQWRDQDYTFLLELVETLLNNFEDKQTGGFFFTAHQHEKLIQRSKTFVDEATPAGNGSAARALIRLSHLTGNTNYLTAGEHCLKAAWPEILRYPSAHNNMLIALEEFLTPPQLIILYGEPSEITSWQHLCNQHYLPQRMIFAIPHTAQALPPLLRSSTPATAKATAYICAGQQCLAPITDLATFIETLNSKSL